MVNSDKQERSRIVQKLNLKFGRRYRSCYEIYIWKYSNLQLYCCWYNFNPFVGFHAIGFYLNTDVTSQVDISPAVGYRPISVEGSI